MNAFQRRDGYLYLEDVRLADLLQAGLATPFFIYSAAELARCYQAYADAARGMDATIGYAVKANHQPALLRHFLAQGARDAATHGAPAARAGMTVVSGNELQLALQVGCAPAHIVMHGNGKRPEELQAAIAAGVLVSLDSPFDLRHALQAARRLSRPAQVLLRVNPDIDPQVHPYIATGMRDAKFGMSPAQIQALLPELAAAREALVLRGLHCHLGSTLSSIAPFRDAAALTIALALDLRASGFPTIDAVDLGGGLGIDYHGDRPAPTPADLLQPLRALLGGTGLRLHLEPGRSLVASAGALVGRVLGVKEQEGGRRYLVCDASMAQLLRPCLYDAYHRIELCGPPQRAELLRCDVVGPICESADFLGRDRDLPTPAEGDGLVIRDAGAYGFAMASRYNLNLLPAEYLVTGASVRCVRRAETLADLLATAVDAPVEHKPLTR